jgi:hypothetical protein
MKKIKYWYKTVTYECVLCGKETTHKYRVYGDKPTDPADRFEWHQDACATHFI